MADPLVYKFCSLLGLHTCGCSRTFSILSAVVYTHQPDPADFDRSIIGEHHLANASMSDIANRSCKRTTESTSDLKTQASEYLK